MKHHRQIDRIESRRNEDTMVDELDESPIPDPESEPPADEASLETAAVDDDDNMEADSPDEEESVSEAS
jgi:hypothetical protein